MDVEPIKKLSIEKPQHSLSKEKEFIDIEDPG